MIYYTPQLFLFLSWLMGWITSEVRGEVCEVKVDGSEHCTDDIGILKDGGIDCDEAKLDHIDPRSLPSKVVGLSCRDEDKGCSYFRKMGECMRNPQYMSNACPVTCGKCEQDDSTWPKVGDIGVAQFVPENMGEEFKQDVLDIMRESRRYLHEEVLFEGGYLHFPEVVEDCTNHHELCSIWVNQDQCDENRPYMRQNCRLACQLCKDHQKFLHGMSF